MTQNRNHRIITYALSTKEDVANQFVSFLVHNKTLIVDTHGDKSVDDLIHALDPYIERSKEEYSMEPAKTKLSMDEIISHINHYFDDKAIRNRLDVAGKLAAVLSRFFSIYRTYFFKLHYGLQVKLTLEDEYSLKEKQICTHIKKYLSSISMHGLKPIYLGENKEIIASNLKDIDLINIHQLIAHCLDVLKTQEIFHHQFLFERSEIFKAHRVLSTLQELIPMNRRSEYVEGLFAHFVENNFYSNDNLNDLQYKAIVTFKNFIPEDKRAFVIDQLIAHLQDERKVFATGPVIALCEMNEFISPEQSRKIIAVTLEYIEKTNSNSASKFLHQFKNHFTEEDFAKIKLRIEQMVGEKPENTIFYATCAYLAMLLPDTEAYENIKQKIPEFSQKIYNIMRLQLVKSNEYPNHGDEVIGIGSCETFSISETLISIQDLFSKEQKLRMLNLVISRVKNINTGYRSNHNIDELKLILQFLMLKDLFPKEKYLAENYMPYAQDEEELRKAETTGSEASIVWRSGAWGNETISYDSDRYYKIEAGEIDALALQSTLTQYLSSVITNSSIIQFKIFHKAALKQLLCDSSFVSNKLIRHIFYDLHASSIESDYDSNKIVVDASKTWVDSLLFDERSRLISHLMAENSYVPIENAAIALYVMHLQQQEIAALHQSALATWSKMPADAAPANNEHQKKACMIQTMFRAHKARNVLRELKEEKKQGLQRWQTYQDFKCNLNNVLKQMSESIGKDDMASVSQSLNTFFSSHYSNYGTSPAVTLSTAANYAKNPALSEVDQKRFGVTGYAHLKK